MIDVEALVTWALLEQRAAESVGGDDGLEDAEARVSGLARRRASACGCAAIERALRLGALIPSATGGRGPAMAPECDPDAATVYAAASGLGGAAARLVISHGRLGTRPDWVPRGARLGPVLDGAGRPRVEAEWDDNRHAKRRWCPLGWIDPPEHVADCRRTWGIWRDGLAALVPLLGVSHGGPGLRRFVALGPAVAARPWRGHKMIVSQFEI